MDRKVNDGEWYHVDFQRDGRSGEEGLPHGGVGGEGGREEEQMLASLKPFIGNVCPINAAQIKYKKLKLRQVTCCVEEGVGGAVRAEIIPMMQL